MPSPIPLDGGLHGGPIARGADRRKEARRRDEAELHYAKEALLAAALAFAMDPRPGDAPLRVAAHKYRDALEEVNARPRS
jgi:predicted metal-dependent phosphoesterase TrpH